MKEWMDDRRWSNFRFTWVKCSYLYWPLTRIHLSNSIFQVKGLSSPKVELISLAKYFHTLTTRQDVGCRSFQFTRSLMLKKEEIFSLSINLLNKFNHVTNLFQVRISQWKSHHFLLFQLRMTVKVSLFEQEILA